MPLIALLLAYDAIVGEDEGGTLMLLLTYRWAAGRSCWASSSATG